MRHTTSPRGAVQAAAAMCTVGSLTAVSSAIDRYPVYGGQAVRYAVAAVILLGLARWRQRVRALPRITPTAREWAVIAALAATGLAGFNVCIVEGTHYTSPAMIGTVIGTVPIVLAVVAPLLERRRPARRLVGAAVIVAAGAALAYGPGGGGMPGLLLAIGALAGEVCFSLLALPLLPRLGPVRVSAYTAAVAAPLLFGTGVVVDGSGVLRVPSPGEAAGLAYLSLFVTVGAFVVWYDALGLIGADRAGLFAGLIPVSAVLGTVALGLRAPTVTEAAGALLVGCGVAAGLARSAADGPLPADVAQHDHEQQHREGDHDDAPGDTDDHVEGLRVVRRPAEQGR